MARVSIQRSETLVVIDVRRHPDKDGDAITELGQRQIRRVTSRDHAGMVYDVFGCSGANRTAQTVRAMMEELSVSSQATIRVLPGLHYRPAMEIAGITDDDFISTEKRVMELCASENRQDTVGDWFKALPVYARAAGTMMTATLLNIACELAYSDGKRALLASHSPFTEMAVGEMSFPRLPVSAGVRYNVRVENGSAMITSWELLLPADETCVSAASPSLKGATK